MLKRIGGALASLLVMTLSAASAQDDRALMWVWFTSRTCPPVTDGSPGSTPALAVAVESFADPHYAAFSGDDDVPYPPPPSDFECKFIRLTGFVQWMDYYHYRATLTPSAADAYGGSRLRYIIENFIDPSVRRAALARRSVTLVGQFYDLCAAAARQQPAGEHWWLFGPCHYGNDNGMMLANVTVEAVHDAAPVYLLGERNRAVVGDMTPHEGAQRAAMIDALRRWSVLVRNGPEAFADEHMSAYPILAERSAEERQDIYNSITSADGYIAYVNQHPRFRRLNLRRAQVEVFHDSEDAAPSMGVGCMCLTRSCADAWPLTERDADTFLGDAVCTDLQRERDGSWRW